MVLAIISIVINAVLALLVLLSDHGSSAFRLGLCLILMMFTMFSLVGVLGYRSTRGKGFEILAIIGFVVFVPIGLIGLYGINRMKEAWDSPVSDARPARPWNSKLMRLFVVISCSVTLASLAVGLLEGFRSRVEEIKRLQVISDGMKARLAAELPGPVWNVDTASLETLLQAEMQGPEVESISLVGPNGPIIAFERLPDGTIQQRETPSPNPDDFARMMELVYNDNGTPKDLGRARWILSNDAVAGSFWAPIQYTALVIVLMNAALFCIFHWMARRDVPNETQSGRIFEE